MSPLPPSWDKRHVGKSLIKVEHVILNFPTQIFLLNIQIYKYCEIIMKIISNSKIQPQMHS